MNRQPRFFLFLALSLSLPFFGCAKSEQTGGLRGCLGPQCPPEVTGESSTLSEPTTETQTILAPPAIICSAIPSKDVVAPQEMLTVTISASGGEGAPYSLPGYGSFTSQLTVEGSYNNSSSTSRIVDKSFYIYDNDGNAGACSFRVTVQPVGTPATPSCTLTSLTAFPMTGADTILRLHVNSETYKFKKLFIQQGWEEIIDQNRAGDSDVTVRFSTPGHRDITATVNYGGQDRTCSTSLDVARPQVVLAALPYTSQPAGSPIQLKAFTSGFSADPINYIWSANTIDSHVFVSAAGNLATVSTDDNIARTLVMSVRASQGTQGSSGYREAMSTLTVHFWSVAPLNCSLGVPTGLLRTNTTYAFPVASSEGITFSSVEAGANGYMPYGVTNPLHINYTTPGTKVIRVHGARGASTGRLCNGTGELTRTFDVGSTLASCDAITSPNASIAGTIFTATARVPAGVGVGPFRATVISSSNPFDYIKEVDPMNHRLRFKKPGLYTLHMDVTDTFDGRTVRCSVAHKVEAANTMVAGTDTPGKTIRAVKGSPYNDFLTGTSFAPFWDVMPNFTGGIRVATADVNGDGTVDIVAAAGYDGGLRVRIFDGRNLAQMTDFFSFVGGISGANRTYIAAGDVNADGKAEIIVGAGCNSRSPLVEIYTNQGTTLLTRFSSNDNSGGNRVAVGDVDGDGYSDVVTSSCVNSNIRVFSGKTLSESGFGVRPAPIRDFMSHPGVSTETKVAVGDVNGDGYADIITGTNGVFAQYVKVFNGMPGSSNSPIFTYKPFNNSGINFVGVVDINSDGLTDIMIGADASQWNQTPEVKVLSGATTTELVGPSGLMGRWFPFTGFKSRIYVGGGTGGL